MKKFLLVSTLVLLAPALTACSASNSSAEASRDSQARIDGVQQALSSSHQQQVHHHDQPASSSAMHLK